MHNVSDTTPFFLHVWICHFCVAVAAVATQMNCELNSVEPPVCLTKNIIGRQTEAFDLILLGDMFYDEALASSLHSWLDLLIQSHGTTVLIGDPGRAQFEGHGIRRFLRRQAQYELPASVREENYGLTCSTVWLYCPEPWEIFFSFCGSRNLFQGAAIEMCTLFLSTQLIYTLSCTFSFLWQHQFWLLTQQRLDSLTRSQ